MIITITCVNGVTTFSPANPSVAVTDSIAWSNEDSRQNSHGEHLLVNMDTKQPFFIDSSGNPLKLLPMPPPSSAYFFQPTDVGKTFHYSCSLHPGETGSFTVVATL